MTKNPKLQLCKQHFPSEALSIKESTKYSGSKGTCVGTAAILDFLVYLYKSRAVVLIYEGYKEIIKSERNGRNCTGSKMEN